MLLQQEQPNKYTPADQQFVVGFINDNNKPNKIMSNLEYINQNYNFKESSF